MEQIIINGGHPLYGNVSINGMKNAALPIICACILNEESCIIDNIPPVSDIETLLDLLATMGANVNRLTKYSVEINCKNIIPGTSSMEMASKIRGSSYLLGAEFGRFGTSSVPHPGGCSIGARPLDLHMKAFEALGASCYHKNGRLEVESDGRAIGNTVYFDKVSVGATANTILASVLAEGTTIIDNAAREPHIVDLAVFLNACGADITGAGTSVIKVKGVEKLHGCRYSIIPDMIEAGTYMAAVAATGGRVTVSNVIPMAAMQSYTFIRHANSGSANYEAGDLMLYYLAMAEVYSYIEYLKRAYGVARVYAQRNRYLPDTLLTAMRINSKSVYSDLSAFRYGLNLIINKAASFAVPNTMSLFARRAFLYQGIYTEGSSIKDQLYMYIPAGFYQYEWEEGKLKFNSLAGGNPGTKTVMEHLEVLNTMVDKIIANEDMGIMNGDIIKAYGDNIIKLSHLDADYTVAPAYDPLVLEQMQNATVLGSGLIDLDDLEISSEYSGSSDLTGVSIVKQRLAMNVSDLLNIQADKRMTVPTRCEKFCELAKLVGEQVITTMLPEPTPSDVIEITRMMVGVDQFDNTYGATLNTGTELCVGLEIWTRPVADPSFAVLTLQPHLNTELAGSKSVAISTKSTNFVDSIAAYAPDSYGAWANSGAIELCNIANRANFKFAPLIYVYAWEDINTVFANCADNAVLRSSVDKLPATRFIGNMSNFTTIDESELYKLHSCAIMNEFATPHLAIK